MPQLVVEKGRSRNARLVIEPGASVVVGREAGADLRIRDAMVSRQHFRVSSEGGDFFVEDLDSANGTFLNGAPLRKRLPLVLSDTIQAGEALLSFLPVGESAKQGGLIGKEIAGHLIQERLGRGGMGTVYKALQKSLDRTVALKILAPKLVSSPSFIEMFVREARACAALSHPNVVQVHDVGEESGVHYFSMEYAEGGSLQNRIRGGATLPLAEAIATITDACRALEYAEKKGIVHRDLKPDNLFLDAEGRVKVGDLGLAYHVQADTEQQAGVFGTPQYMAPEQVRSEPLDHRADLYALGGTFFRIVTGTRAFSGASKEELLHKQLHEPPPDAHERNPDVPPAIADIIITMMAKDPDDRQASASEVIAELESARRKLARGPRRSAAVARGARLRPRATTGRRTRAGSAGEDGGVRNTLADTGTPGRRALGKRAREYDAPRRSPLPLILGIVGALAAAGGLIAVMSDGGPPIAPRARSAPSVNRATAETPRRNHANPPGDHANRANTGAANRPDRGQAPGGEQRRLFNERARLQETVAARWDAIVAEYGYTPEAEVALEEFEAEVAKDYARLLDGFENPVLKPLTRLRYILLRLAQMRDVMRGSFSSVRQRVRDAMGQQRFGRAARAVRDFIALLPSDPRDRSLLSDAERAALAEPVAPAHRLDAEVARTARAAFATAERLLRNLDRAATSPRIERLRAAAQTFDKARAWGPAFAERAETLSRRAQALLAREAETPEPRVDRPRDPEDPGPKPDPDQPKPDPNAGDEFARTLREFLGANKAARKELGARLLKLAGGDLLKLHAKLVDWGTALAPAPTGDQEVRFKLGRVEESAALYVPSKYTPAKAWPLLMLSHGTNGSGSTLRDRFRDMAEARGVLLVAPTQTQGDPRWGWRDDQRDLHTLALRAVAGKYHVDPTRIWFFGVSRGGHAAWDIGMHRPGIFAALFSAAGSPALKELRLLPNLRGTTVVSVVGANEDALMRQNLRFAASELRALKIAARFEQKPGAGHLVDVSPEDVWRRLGGVSAGIPTRIELATTDDVPWASAWLEVTSVSKSATRMPRKIEVPRSFARLAKDRQRQEMLKYFKRYRARVDATFKPEENSFTILAKNVRRITLGLDPRAVDFSRPVLVFINAELVHDKLVRAKASVALDALGDNPLRRVLPVAQLKLSVRR